MSCPKRWYSPAAAVHLRLSEEACLRGKIRERYGAGCPHQYSAAGALRPSRWRCRPKRVKPRCRTRHKFENFVLNGHQGQRVGSLSTREFGFACLFACLPPCLPACLPPSRVTESTAPSEPSFTGQRWAPYITEKQVPRKTSLHATPMTEGTRTGQDLSHLARSSRPRASSGVTRAATSGCRGPTCASTFSRVLAA